MMNEYSLKEYEWIYIEYEFDNEWKKSNNDYNNKCAFYFILLLILYYYVIHSMMITYNSIIFGFK